MIWHRARHTTDLHKTLISINLSDASSSSLIEFSCVMFIFFLVCNLCHVVAYPSTYEFSEGLIEQEPGLLLARRGC